MPLTPAPDHQQRLADAVDLHQVQMRRAAATVRAHVTEPGAREELLECLGLSDVAQPR